MLIEAVLSPTVVVNPLTSVEMLEMSPSLSVTRTDKPPTALAFAAIPVFAPVSPTDKVVMSAAWLVIEPSVAVTLVVSPPIAVALPLMFVLAEVRLLDKAVMSPA